MKQAAAFDRQYVRQVARSGSSARLRLWGVVATAGAVLTDLLVPLVVGYAVAHSLNDDISWRVWGLVALTVLGSALMAGASTALLSRATAQEMRAVRVSVAQRLFGIDPRTLERMGVDEAVSLYTRDTDQLVSLMTGAHVHRWGAAVTAMGALLMMVVLEWRLFATLLAVLLLGVALIAVTLRGLKAEGTLALSSMGAMAAVLGDYLRSLRSARVYDLGPAMFLTLQRDVDAVERVDLRMGLAQAIVDVTVRAATMGALLTVGVVGGALVRSGTTTPSVLTAFLVALTVLAAPAARVADSVQQRQQALSALPRLEGLHGERQDQTVPAPQPPIRPDAARVRLRDAVVKVADETWVGPVTFTAQCGDLICLTGPSGAGKSSILRALAGFLPIVSGDAWVGGRPLREWHPAALHRSIALVEQDSPFTGLSIREFLGRPGPSSSCWGLIDDLGLSARVAELGLDTPIQRAGASLSGGERQRLALVRALGGDRPILILDEPTSHLDPRNEELAIKAILQRRGDRVILASTHSLALKRAADRVVVLGGDHLAQTGPTM